MHWLRQQSTQACPRFPGTGLSPADEDMQAVHNLLNGCGVIPPVQIEDINPVCLQLFERIANTHMQAPPVISTVVRRKTLFLEGMCLVIRSVLGCKDNLVTVFPSRHPFSNPCFRLLVLVCVCGVDKVASGCNVGVKECEYLLLVHASP